jgi:hypothetical protein
MHFMQRFPRDFLGRGGPTVGPNAATMPQIEDAPFQGVPVQECHDQQPRVAGV